MSCLFGVSLGFFVVLYRMNYETEEGIVRIHKLLNNNAVIILDENNREIILTGRGIAYQKKVGDTVDEQKIEKRYTLNSPTISEKMKELLSEIPIAYFELANLIVEKAENELKTKFHESLYLTLTDHLYGAVTRAKSGVHTPNLMLWDIKRFYKEEFKIGLWAIEYIYKHYRLRLKEDEAGFLALHLVNARLNMDDADVYEVTDLMKEILQITSYYFKLHFDEDSLYYYRFTTHIRFFASRITSGKQVTDETEEDLLLLIQQKYKNAYQCVEKISQFIQQKYHYEMGKDERLYLTIHVARLVQKTTQENEKL